MNQSENSTKRVFLGVPASEAIKLARKELVQEIGMVDGIRWAPEENLHMTVLFIGVVPELMIENLKSLIRLSLHGIQSFGLIDNRWTLAPAGKPPRMIWLQYSKQQPFSDLVSLIRTRLETVISLPQQHQNPTPHITVARLNPQLKIPSDFREVRKPDGIFEVKTLILWESILSPEGAEYLPLAEFTLS